MSRNLFTDKGEASFDGINPKIKTFCGMAFGWHKAEEPCVNCRHRTHYSLHRKYPLTKKLENHNDPNHKGNEAFRNWPLDTPRLWCCSEECFKSIILVGMYDLVVPVDIAEKVLDIKE